MKTKLLLIGPTLLCLVMLFGCSTTPLLPPKPEPILLKASPEHLTPTPIPNVEYQKNGTMADSLAKLLEAIGSCNADKESIRLEQDRLSRELESQTEN